MTNSRHSPFFSITHFITRASVGVQLSLAALMWLTGTFILLIRGFGYIHDRHWHAWALSIGLILGVVKSKTLLDSVASRAVKRIRIRGRGTIIGFFSLRSWLMVAVMMGGGIGLRKLFVHPGVIGAGILGTIYISVGTALLLADRIFWMAVFRHIHHPPPRE
jgi:hypothetical protein